MNLDRMEFKEDFKPGFLDDDVQTELVKRAQSGDSDAFARLYDHYVDGIYRYVYYLLMERKASEDLTARVFLKAWKNLDLYESGEESFGAWLFVLAGDEVSREKIAKKEKIPVNEIIAFASHELQTDEDNEQPLETDALRDALKTLSWDQQNVVILKFISGMTTDDIASHLGQSPDSVRVLQRKALQTLARHYGYGK